MGVHSLRGHPSRSYFRQLSFIDSTQISNYNSGSYLKFSRGAEERAKKGAVKPARVEAIVKVCSQLDVAASILISVWLLNSLMRRLCDVSVRLTEIGLFLLSGGSHNL